jgi:hypothetical protein
MMYRAYQGHGPIDAFLVRDWLERNEIRTFVRGEHLVSLRGDLPVAWPSVWVAIADRERAVAAVTTYHQPALVHPVWNCPGCGEENPPAFGSCWNCGREAA